MRGRCGSGWRPAALAVGGASWDGIPQGFLASGTVSLMAVLFWTMHVALVTVAAMVVPSRAALCPTWFLSTKVGLCELKDGIETQMGKSAKLGEEKRYT